MTTASIVLPAVVLAPVMKTAKQNKEQELDKKLIEGYMQQLEEFREKILGFL